MSESVIYSNSHGINNIFNPKLFTEYIYSSNRETQTSNMKNQLRLKLKIALR